MLNTDPLYEEKIDVILFSKLVLKKSKIRLRISMEINLLDAGFHPQRIPVQEITIERSLDIV